MIAASEIIEFVAKVAVTIVEDAVEDELARGDRNHESHPAG